MGIRARTATLAACGAVALAGCGGFPPVGTGEVGDDGRLNLSGEDSVTSATAVDPIFDALDQLQDSGELTEGSVRGALAAAGYDAEDIEAQASDDGPGVFFGVHTGGAGCVSGFVDGVSVSAHSTGFSFTAGCIDTSGVTD